MAQHPLPPLHHRLLGLERLPQNFAATRHFDIVKQTKDTYIASYGTSVTVLGVHTALSLIAAWYFVRKRR